MSEKLFMPDDSHRKIIVMENKANCSVWYRENNQD